MYKFLEVVNVSKKIGDFELGPVSMDAEEHQIVGLVGKNGAGKTTFMRSIFGLYADYHGFVKICGEKFDPTDLNIKRKIVFLPETTGLPGFLTGDKLASVMAKFYPAWDEVEYKRLLTVFEVPEYKKVSKLSTGNKKKLGIAATLSTGASVYLFDEPTSNVDPISRDIILSELEMFYKNRPVSIIFSSHILYDVQKVSQKLLVLREGKMTYWDDIPEVMDIEKYENKILDLLR